ncbi:MAG: heparinase II/III family protein, partial [Prolixibacteraceae bacterium]|nr:heparinase II/III family protein [Prolixibacteraceae bacterium]
PADGGCDEGPSYWGRAGASLFQNLDLLKRATKGKFNVFNNQLIQNMGSYIYKAYINYPYFLNFADADATTGSRPEIIYNYGKAISDPVMQEFGAFLAKKQDWGNKIPGGKIDEQIMQLMYLNEITKAKAANALIFDFWLPETEIAGARDKAGSANGFFFAAKGGFNNESHNHNDAGSCVMYYNGEPCLVDIGSEKYTAKTFSSRRYEIWTMQSQYHNLPKINGIDQAPGSEFKARLTNFQADSKKAVFSTNISDAYPKEAAVNKWVRSYRLDRGKKFTISDNFQLTKVKAATSLNFVTSCSVSENAPGVINLKGKDFNLNMKYNARALSLKIELKEVTDSKLNTYWPDGITRIVLTMKKPTLKGKNQVVISEAK